MAQGLHNLRKVIPVGSKVCVWVRQDLVDGGYKCNRACYVRVANADVTFSLKLFSTLPPTPRTHFSIVRGIVANQSGSGPVSVSGRGI